jgi:hypothetical protein
MFVASFFQKDAYVGHVQVDLFRTTGQAGRVALDGFSIAVPVGADWFLAQPRSGRIETLENVWFVRDPHRFTVWAKRNRVPAKPTIIFAELVSYGRPEVDDIAARVRERKQREFGVADITVQRLETEVERIGLADCARYVADLEDRRGAPGFDKIPFLVSIAGHVCLHPDAPWLALDIGYSRRRLPTDPAFQQDRTLDAIAESVTIGHLAPPLAQDLLVIGDKSQLPTVPDGVRLDEPRFVGSDLWAFQKGLHDANGLTRFDKNTGRPVETRPGGGRFLGTTQRVIWTMSFDKTVRGSSLYATVRRMDVADGSVTNFQTDCIVTGNWVFDATDDYIWLPCSQLDQQQAGTKNPKGGLARSLLTRIGRSQEESVTIDLPWPAYQVRASGSHVWALGGMRDCALVQIDADTLSLMRTISVTSEHCNRMTVAGDAIWLATSGKSPEKLIKVDTASGRTIGTVVLPKGRSVVSMASGAGAVWVSTTWDHFSSTRQPALSQAELLKIDLQSTQVLKKVATGWKFRVFQVEDDRVWLSDADGALLTIRLK